MKLLLTSDGITNQSIADALFELVGKKPSDTSIAFIPTAMNVNDGDKSWFADDLYNIKKLGLKNLDVVDISALPKKLWLPRLEKADVLFFSGGNSSHLMRWVKESGLKELLPDLLKTRVYGSISAGSISAAPDLALGSKERKIFYKENFGYESEEGLGLVNFYVQAHLNSTYFPKRTEENLRAFAKDFGKTMYALDYNSALKVVEGNVEVVSEGKYLKLN